MNKKFLVGCAAACMAFVITLSPINASAATLLKKGSSGSEVVKVQSILKDLGYYTYSKTTGYYGSITVTAVKHFQKEHGLYADGIVGSKTMTILIGSTENKTEAADTVTTEAQTDTKTTVTETKTVTVAQPLSGVQTVSGSSLITAAAQDPSNNIGALDWFSTVRNIWKRGEDAVVTDIDTGLSFTVKRTYGTNHADVEPLTKEDTDTIKKIWGGFSWERRAVIVQFEDYTLAASMTAMPHAGVESAPANKYVSHRSAGYGSGLNLDAVKNNGASGVMDIHFKGSRTHSTNVTQKSQQDMVSKAAAFLKQLLANI